MTERVGFSLASALAGRRLLLTGVTGFVGKVTLAMLLEHHPVLGRLHVLVRPRQGCDAEQRFHDAVLRSPAFRSLRRRHGNAFERYVRERVAVVAGDVTQPDLGIPEPLVAALAGNLDAIVNVAGLVSFNPAMDMALQINAHGAHHAARLARAVRARLVHMSTCYVAGWRDGEVGEREPISGYFPYGLATPGTFSAATELAACDAFVADLVERARGEMSGTFRERALARLAAKGRTPSPNAVSAGIRRQERLWIEEQLVEEGRCRAQRWGWPNIYCFTKSLGEQLIAETAGLEFAIVRPSIVESAWRYPFPGWNEGLNASAQVILTMCTGHALWPAHPTAPLDVIPVDLVASGTIAATAALLSGRGERVYHLGTSDSNPLSVRRYGHYIGQYRRRHYRDHAPNAAWTHWLWTRAGVFPVSARMYRRFGVPAFRRAAAGIARLFATPPRKLVKIERDLAQIEHVVDTFIPFMHEMNCVFRTDNLRNLYAQLPEPEAANCPWDPEAIDWRRYWFDVHVRGLRQWVFPGLPGRRDGGTHQATQSLPNRVVRNALNLVHRLFYGRIFRAAVVGREHVPDVPGFIVASNHASHLDMGLIKYALGPSGAKLVALAAKDYFFRNPVLNFFFRNYTNLLPIGRNASVKDSLTRASQVLLGGRSLLIFPEATRTTTGRMAKFKPTVGYLALKNEADVLPVYLAGTFDCLPKGGVLPKTLRMAAHLGPVLPHAELRKATAHLPDKEASRAATVMIEGAVRALECQAALRGAVPRSGGRGLSRRFARVRRGLSPAK
jgi:1-acyl-sn-glycerol-3-phosphate acyltransferase